MSDELRAALAVPVEEAARRLLGCLLVRTIDGKTLSGRIVETEAYDQTDAASHSYKGKTPRTDVMFGPPGHLYVYFTYGMHYCCNVVTGSEGHGAAVLIRALEPVQGELAMSRYRGGRSGPELTKGPAKLCQALQINRTQNGHDLRLPPLQLLLQPPLAPELIVQTGRVGLTKNADAPLRFYIKGNVYVSKK